MWFLRKILILPRCTPCVAWSAAVATAWGMEPVSVGTVPEFSVARVTELQVADTAVSGPKWSPDGQWIAYSLAKGKGIGIVRADGSLRRVLTCEPGSGHRFSWAPDGSGIAFRTTPEADAPRRHVIRVVTMENGEIEHSSGVEADLQPPVWQAGPEGMRWVSHSPGCGMVAGPWQKLSRMELSGAAQTVTPPLLAAHSRSIWLHAEGSAPLRKLSGDFGLNPVWNRQGTRFAFDARDVVAVSSPEAQDGPQMLFAGQHPAWSPDGRWIAYQLTRDHTHTAEDTRQHTADTLPHLHDDKTNHRIVDSELWICAADGDGRRQLTFTPDLLEEDPDWSPDGRCIVCHLENSGRLLLLHLNQP